MKKILDYAKSSPLAFLGFSCWTIVPLGFIFYEVVLDNYVPGWFYSFLIFLGFLFLGLAHFYREK